MICILLQLTTSLTKDTSEDIALHHLHHKSETNLNLDTHQRVYACSIYKYATDLLKRLYHCNEPHSIVQLELEIANLFCKAQQFIPLTDREIYERELRHGHYIACYEILQDYCRPMNHCLWSTFFRFDKDEMGLDRLHIHRRILPPTTECSYIAIFYTLPMRIKLLKWCPRGRKCMFKETLYLPDWVFRRECLLRATIRQEYNLFLYLLYFINGCKLHKRAHELLALFVRVQSRANMGCIMHAKLALITLVSSIISGCDCEMAYRITADVLRSGCEPCELLMAGRHAMALLHHFGRVHCN